MVILGAAFGPVTLIVCAVLAVVVWLAAAAIPQRSEDRLHLWLGLVAKPAPLDRAGHIQAELEKVEAGVGRYK